ncbi:MAG TPA: hypothetical protein EYP57_03950, partial [Thermodesulfobacteriaceae bacterium]|nr:hypothetical protein [Thermodesulfobacteriaceae bacterium]
MNSSACWTERILALTREVRKRDLALHLGRDVSWECISDTVDLRDIRQLESLAADSPSCRRLYFQASDHFLRQQVEPFQAMLSTWMKGAMAHIHDARVPFSQVITWCQDAEDRAARRILAREVLALCRFLAPFCHASWKALLASVETDLGFTGYPEYCETKRQISLAVYESMARQFLAETREAYQDLIGRWL